MGIGQKKPKFPTFLRKALFRVVVDSMHKNIHCGAHGCLRDMGLEREESRIALSSGLCLESWK